MLDLTVAALYRFAPLEDFEERRVPLQDLCQSEGLCGTLLLAREGINGTLAGRSDGIETVLGYIRSVPGFEALEVKYSTAPAPPFRRMKVRLKDEIVRMGVPGIDPNRTVGTYVAPEDWNALITDPETLVIDTRNAFEVAIGSFPGAVDPATTAFGEFPDWADRNLGTDKPPKKIAMFCTGGIRCEKATAYLKERGHGEVYHLKGGILKYLETVPEEESLWQGECFVFDERVAVGQGLAVGTHIACHACGRPVSPEGTHHPDYVDGESCAACVGEYTDADRARFRTRHAALEKCGGKSR